MFSNRHLLSWVKLCIKENIWILGSGGIYDLFTNSQTQNIDDPEARLFTSTSKHFKSDIMNNWNSVGIEQVIIYLRI